MKFTATNQPGAAVVDLTVIADERGYFGRVWSEEEGLRAGFPGGFVLTSLSYNARAGTVRGMHYQAEPHGEIKLVRCIRGAIFDVIVDLRPDSPTFRRWFGAELTAANHRALYIPKGFAHGFQTLEDESEVFYQLSHDYVAQAGRGVRFDDPAFGIAWPRQVAVINERDRTFADFAPDRAP